MRVVVTGGAGYVGSVSVEALVAAGHDVVVLDNLSTGHRTAVPEGASLVVGSYGDAAAVARLFDAHQPDAVLHCGAKSLVPESVANPALYYGENVCGGIVLLEAMRLSGVPAIVLSSTAAVYGVPSRVPIEEGDPAAPISPYGETKRTLESAIGWYGRAYGLKSVIFRYFNVAGASDANGEDHSPETHLIPCVLEAAEGKRQLQVFGSDYPTRDGTCVRDYIHAEDLARAHLLALEAVAGGPRAGVLPAGGEPLVCNLGSGSGFTNLEVLASAERIVGRRIPWSMAARRPGDPAALVAQSKRAQQLLGWQPQHGSLDDMIGSAWEWRCKHPAGYTGEPDGSTGG